MTVIRYIVCVLFYSSSVFAQEIKTNSIEKNESTIDNDTILDAPVLLEEVIIHRDKLDPEAKKQFLILQNRVYKVYPFAKVASERLTGLNKNMAQLKTSKEKKKYFKIVEAYIENEFTDKLKKLSRKQGQILIKLIHRQTGVTTFDLIKEYKSGWNAFWSNNTARLFDLNLKTKYAPYEVNEDYLIETILDRAFTNGRLINQAPANPIDYNQLTEFWYNKAASLNKSIK
jgi:hypothetical protein